MKYIWKVFNEFVKDYEETIELVDFSEPEINQKLNEMIKSHSNALKSLIYDKLKIHKILQEMQVNLFHQKIENFVREMRYSHIKDILESFLKSWDSYISKLIVLY